ncbi:MAG: hypothetical protein IH845_01675 [Nanoarchaeota archaeon]|nr:hypothetical protein [Nanoarchaeota archaeon]
MKKVDKSGQQMMGMSFGMIFAVFMIVVFLVIAFIAVRGFLDIGDTAEVGLFWKSLQEEVDDAWRGQSSSTKFKIKLPRGVEKICFGDLNGRITGLEEDYLAVRDFEVYDANAFLIPRGAAEGLEFKLISHINLEKIIEDQNPYCVDVTNGLVIEKDFYDKLVIIR